ncbi:MAG: tetraacyldisaccharide 4'-kinase [Tannerellaceae bacterium]|jgi:tetraacyldisaccharide 4'-kinase|nr:tetraacyldisaccharide 4'-kinase [Tannerellaceae bacterium]
MPEENSFKPNYFLTPFSLFYGLGVRIRNLLFNWEMLPSEEFPVPVISIGNLAVGGTGKTPHVEYLIRLLKDKYKVAVLSRGYKRKTKGFLLADDKSTFLTIGDEPFQIKRKYPNILVAVDNDRRKGIRNLLQLPENKRPEIILLDDAFQHRYVTPSLSIVMTDYNRLYYRDMLLPAGRLREPVSGIHRADAVIVTKCAGNLKPIDYRIITDEMRLLAHQQLYFTHVLYGRLEPLFPASINFHNKHSIKEDDDILLLTGIASPEPFIREINSRSKNVKVMTFPDHHIFSKQDIRKINETFNRINTPEKYILVTEKDAARLLKNPAIPEEWKSVLFYLPITIGFGTTTHLSLDDLVLNHIVTFRRNSIFR